MDVKTQIQQRLQAFADADLRTASMELLNTLGYRSEKTLDISSVASLQEHLDPHGYLTDENALLHRWIGIQFLFQLTDAEIGLFNAFIR